MICSIVISLDYEVVLRLEMINEDKYKFVLVLARQTICPDVNVFYIKKFRLNDVYDL